MTDYGLYESNEEGDRPHQDDHDHLLPIRGSRCCDGRRRTFTFHAIRWHVFVHPEHIHPMLRIHRPVDRPEGQPRISVWIRSIRTILYCGQDDCSIMYEPVPRLGSRDLHSRWGISSQGFDSDRIYRDIGRRMWNHLEGLGRCIPQTEFSGIESGSEKLVERYVDQLRGTHLVRGDGDIGQDAVRMVVPVCRPIDHHSVHCLYVDIVDQPVGDKHERVARRGPSIGNPARAGGYRPVPCRTKWLQVIPSLLDETGQDDRDHHTCTVAQ